MAVDTMVTYPWQIRPQPLDKQVTSKGNPTVSLSKSRIFILADVEEPDVEGSPAVTILEIYPETAATTSMVRVNRPEEALEDHNRGQVR